MAGDVDPVTEEPLIGQTTELEKFQSFVRAHLENASGSQRAADHASPTRSSGALTCSNCSGPPTSAHIRLRRWLAYSSAACLVPRTFSDILSMSFCAWLSPAMS